MPSTNQKGDDTAEYRTEADRMVDTKPEQLLLSIKPMTESNARDWVGACNRYDASDELTEHFVDCVKRLTED